MRALAVVTLAVVCLLQAFDYSPAVFSIITRDSYGPSEIVCYDPLGESWGTCYGPGR